VRISYPASALDARVRRYWFAAGAIALTVLAVAALLGSLLAGWVARPLEHLATTAEAMGDGDLSVRADTQNGPPEVRMLAARFNDSVATLERFVHDQSEFVADAAHQLRTPLQALRLRLENIERLLPDADDTAHARAGIARALGELERLAGLVTSLLMLERADRGASEAVEPVDIAELVQVRHCDWAELGERNGVRVEVDLPASAVALCRPIHAEQVLDNLVDNAIGVSPEGEAVTVARAPQRRPHRNARQ